MSTDELRIASAGERDLEELAAFMQAQGSDRATPTQLRHWYMGNPSGSASLMIGRMDGRIVGMATTNDHYFDGPEGRVLVAMPQKVLTDASLRGKGIFGKLHRASEEAACSRGVGFFLTVTNAASTPIFLGRFGYERLPVPQAVAMLPAWGGRPRSGGCRNWPSGQPTKPGQGTWSMVKNADHYHWRYLALPHPTHVRLSISQEGECLGELFLKKIRKRGLPVMLLLDLVPTGRSAVAGLVRAARVQAFWSGCVALLALDPDALGESWEAVPHRMLSSNFNLLVKGLAPDHTRQLLDQRYRLAFGDLDFL